MTFHHACVQTADKPIFHYFKVVRSMHCLNKCPQFIAPTKGTILCIRLVQGIEYNISLSTAAKTPQQRTHLKRRCVQHKTSSTKHRVQHVPTNPLLCFAQGAYPSLLSTSVTRVPSFKTLHSPGLSIRQPLVFYHNHHRHHRRVRSTPGSI